LFPTILKKIRVSEKCNSSFLDQESRSVTLRKKDTKKSVHNMLTRISVTRKKSDSEWENNRMTEISFPHFSLRIVGQLERAKVCIEVCNNEQPFIITIVF
jgi:hypothetical protein